MTNYGRIFAFRGPESTYGAGGSGDWNKLRVTGMGDPVNRNVAFEEACDITVPTYAVGGNYVVNGTVDALLRFKSFQPFFTSLLGASNGGKYYLTDTPNSYEFLIGDDQASNNAGVTTAYKGCGISSMELTFAVREFVRARMTWIGQKAEVTTLSAAPDFLVAPSADPAAVYYNAIINVDNTPITVKNLTMRIDRKFDTDYYFIGSPLLQGLYMNGQTDLSGTITLGSGEWNLLKGVMTGGEDTSITANMLTTSAGTENLNEIISLPMEIKLHDMNGAPVGTIKAGNVVFSESNRSVTGRNQWDKTVNYRIIVPTSTDFYIEPAA